MSPAKLFLEFWSYSLLLIPPFTIMFSCISCSFSEISFLLFSFCGVLIFISFCSFSSLFSFSYSLSSSWLSFILKSDSFFSIFCSWYLVTFLSNSILISCVLFWFLLSLIDNSSSFLLYIISSSEFCSFCSLFTKFSSISLSSLISSSSSIFWAILSSIFSLYFGYSFLFCWALRFIFPSIFFIIWLGSISSCIFCLFISSSILFWCSIYSYDSEKSSNRLDIVFSFCSVCSIIFFSLDFCFSLWMSLNCPSSNSL